MGDEKIDGAAFQALAAKLDGMADAFTDTEREALAGPSARSWLHAEE
jgi:hypothetical protein